MNMERCTLVCLVLFMGMYVKTKQCLLVMACSLPPEDFAESCVKTWCNVLENALLW